MEIIERRKKGLGNLNLRDENREDGLRWKTRLCIGRKEDRSEEHAENELID